MRTSQDKKDIIRQYKDRKKVGGIICYENTANGKILIEAAPNLQSAKNRFDFAKSTGSCVTPKLENHWQSCSGDVFMLSVLEELAMGETQSEKEFRDDLAVLCELWKDKLCSKEMY